MVTEDIVNLMQHQTMQVATKAALRYHFKGIVTHFRPEEGTGRLPNMMELNFEAIAYINWVKRIWHYYKNVTSTRPELRDSDFEDVMKPLVDWFANKWASHRAVDFPRKSDSTNLKAYSTQLDTCLMYGPTEGPIFSVIDDSGESLSWKPLKEHDRVMAVVGKFLEEVAASNSPRAKERSQAEPMGAG